jgi:hypothetical protein
MSGKVFSDGINTIITHVMCDKEFYNHFLKYAIDHSIQNGFHPLYKYGRMAVERTITKEALERITFHIIQTDKECPLIIETTRIKGCTSLLYNLYEILLTYIDDFARTISEGKPGVII